MRASLSGLFLLSVLGLIHGDKTERTLFFEENPGCTKYCDHFHLMHVRAEGEQSCLHHFWSFDAGVMPSILLIGTTKNASLNVDFKGYTHQLKNSITFSDPADVHYSFGLLLKNLWVFNDVHDKANLDDVDQSDIKSFPLENFIWTVSVEKNDTEEAAVVITASTYTDVTKSYNVEGSITFRLSTYGSRARSDTLPHLLHTINATQLDLELNRMNLTQFSNPRFGLELMVLESPEYEEEKMDISFTRTLDDEYTPGVFKLYQMMTSNKPGKNHSHGFLEWRPVSYTDKDRDVTHTTAMTYYKMEFLPASDINGTMMNCFYGDDLEHMTVKAVNVSFGEQGDGWYTKTNYATWTVVMSHGSFPGDAVSMLVILVIAIGFGMPAALIVGGVGFLGFKRLQKRKEIFLDDN